MASRFKGVKPGDIVCTRENARWLPISGTDYVRNGYRWHIENVTASGGLRVRHLESGRCATLPADYVADHVTLGYAATIDSAQGVTADHDDSQAKDSQIRRSAHP